MKTLQRKRILGFTIIELMIVVGIVAILLALAYPSYAQYVRKAKRGDAQQLLLNWSINQEIFRSSNTTYADENALPVPVDADANYRYSVSGESATAYTLRAVAQGDQLKDKAKDGTGCSPLTLNQNGVKTEPPCWQ